MKNLLIVGAGRFGREVCEWAKQSKDHGENWRVAGFLDSRRQILDGFCLAETIMGTPEDYAPLSEDVFICAVGDVLQKRKYCEMLSSKGADFANVIHSSVVVSSHARLGRGIILCPGVVIAPNAELGDFVAVNTQSFVAHDVRVASYVQIHANVAINGAAELAEGCVIGSNAAILPDTRVGEYATVGAGSIVLKSVEAGETVFGNPARPLGLPKKPEIAAEIARFVHSRS